MGDVRHARRERILPLTDGLLMGGKYVFFSADENYLPAHTRWLLLSCPPVPVVSVYIFASREGKPISFVGCHTSSRETGSRGGDACGRCMCGCVCERVSLDV